MNFQDLLTAISTVGFPIACCIYLIYSRSKADERYTETISRLKETVDNNTIAMIKIASKLGVDADGK